MAKAYSLDLRERVFKFIKKGGTITEASERFEVSRKTIHFWKKLKKATGKLLPVKRQNNYPKKFTDKALEKYLAKYSSATLLEIGNHFKVTPQTIFYRLKKLKITRKKNAPVF